MKELELMCQYGFDVNERLSKYNNQTPLSIFINKNYSISMLNVLINHGARFDLKDNNGQTCLHYACQSTVNDSIFDFIIEHAPKSCLNISNQSGGTPLDLAYLSTYEQASTSQMRRLHVLLSYKESKLTRYGMREPNLFTRKQYKLFDILSCKEFLFKYRLKDLFDPSIHSLAWCIFLFYDVLRACEKHSTSFTGRITTQQRLEHYFVSMIENGEIPLDKLIFRSNILYPSSSSSSSSSLNEYDKKILIQTENSLLHMTQIKIKLSELRMQTLTLKALCRIKIKKTIRNYPNDIVRLNTISKVLQAYLTFYNPFIKGDAADTI
jgi:ankyrin repeat protein